MNPAIATAGFGSHFLVAVFWSTARSSWCKSLTCNDLCNFWAATKLGLHDVPPTVEEQGKTPQPGAQARAQKLPFLTKWPFFRN